MRDKWINPLSFAVKNVVRISNNNLNPRTSHRESKEKVFLKKRVMSWSRKNTSTEANEAVKRRGVELRTGRKMASNKNMV